MSNAIKSTHEDGLIEVNTTVRDNMVICSVKDNGIGINQDKQQAFLKTTLPVSFGTKGEKAVRWACC